jgi:hypothetical protein
MSSGKSRLSKASCFPSVSRRKSRETPRSRDNGKDPELKSCHFRLGYSGSRLPPKRRRRALQKASEQAMIKWQQLLE